MMFSRERNACEVMIPRAQLYSECMHEQIGKKSAAVFCASASGARPEYAAAADDLGRTLAEGGIGLIYGGGKTGLMGAVADGALAAGGYVVGGIPHVLVDLE